MNYFFISVLCIINTIQIQCDATLQKTLSTELKISRYTESYVQELAKTINKIGRVTEELLSSKWSHLDRGDYISTPLTAMAMVRRLVQEWLPLTTTVGRYSKLTYLSLGEVRWPTTSDLSGAAKVVMRSQITYDLNTALLARGVLSDESLTNITASDYFEIARQYLQNERFREAKEWLQHALAGVRDSDDAPSRETVLYHLAAALCFTNDGISSRNIVRSILKENPFSKLPHDLTDYYIIMSTIGCGYPGNEVYKFLNGKYMRGGVDISSITFFRDSDLMNQHSRLCQGEVKTDRRLVCRYVHYHKPHLRFQPFKLEELQLEPPVVRFHNLLSDKETDSIINQAKYIIEPARVGETSVSRLTDYRTSHVAWLSPNDTVWLTRRISDATHLDAYYSNYHQVSRYSVSGEYMPHHDFFGYEGDAWSNDRISTVMFYLNDVEQGGHTIFTTWNLSVPPVKNSAVMWFNYKPNGEGDESSQHSGCPVLKGTKWVLNKWIKNYGNDITFPCPIDKERSFKGFYL